MFGRGLVAYADRVQAVGLAEAKATEALGVARTAGFAAQREAIGEMPTALVAVAGAVAEGKTMWYPTSWPPAMGPVWTVWPRP